MIDPFVLLTPVLILAVMALLRFIGCEIVFDIPPVVEVTFDPPPGSYFNPQKVTVSAIGDTGADFQYTTDGSDPTGSPTAQHSTGSFVVSVTATTTITGVYKFGSFHHWSNTFSVTYYIGPIVFQQLAEKAVTDNSNTVTTAKFTAAVTQGNLMVVWIWHNSGTQTVNSVTDTANNHYDPAGPPTPGMGLLTGWLQEIWYSKNITGGQNLMVTAVFSGQFNGEKAISAHEYSGADQTAPLDVPLVAATGTSANTSVGPATPVFGRLLFGAAVFLNIGAADPAFMPRSTLKGNVTEDAVIMTPGPVAASFVNVAQDWIAQMVIFR
jgi:hypothetical protein